VALTAGSPPGVSGRALPRSLSYTRNLIAGGCRPHLQAGWRCCREALPQVVLRKGKFVQARFRHCSQNDGALRLLGYGWDMHYLSLLVIVLVFVFVGYLGLVKLTVDLWQTSVHESPAIPDISSIVPAAEAPPLGEPDSRELSPTEWSSTQ
jgi:hypothetical protein